MTSQLLQFGGSLLAILALAWLVQRLGLGGERRILDEAHARALAEDANDGFAPHSVAVDDQGRAALLRDADGRIMLLKMHGSKAAARILQPKANARVSQDSGRDALMVNSGERRFGSSVLDIADPSGWMQQIRAIGVAPNA